jgi:hypothetical protein
LDLGAEDPEKGGSGLNVLLHPRASSGLSKPFPLSPPANCPHLVSLTTAPEMADISMWLLKAADQIKACGNRDKFLRRRRSLYGASIDLPVVRAHDGMNVPLLDREIETVEALLAVDLDVQAIDFKPQHRFLFHVDPSS